MNAYARVEFADRSFCFLTAEHYASIPADVMEHVVDVTIVSDDTTGDDLIEARKRAAENRNYLERITRAA